MTTSTPGRMPVIAFSDDADYETLLDVLQGTCVALVLTDNVRVEVLVSDPGVIDEIGGRTLSEDSKCWNGPEVFVPLDDVVQIIVL